MTNNQPAWEVSWYSKEDKPYILAANQEEYGTSDLAQASYIDWIVDKNPNGPPIFIVARDTDSRQVIGWVLYVPFQLLWQGVVNNIMIGFNLMVRKAYRRHGISTEMIEFGMAEGKSKGYQFMAALANSKSTSVHRKMGDLIGFTIPMVVRPMDMNSLSKVIIKNTFLQWIVQVAWKIAAPTIFHPQHPNHRQRSLTVQEESQIGADFDIFWEKAKGKYNLILARDQKFLQWRFCEMPSRSYRILTARRVNEILGYIILRIADVRGVQCGLISDFLVAPGRSGDAAGLLLMNAATQIFSNEGMQLGGGLMMPHTQEFHIMRKAGYVKSPGRLAPQAITLIIHKLLDEIPTEEILKPASWFISNADHDAV